MVLSNRREDEINGIIDRRECGPRSVCFLLGAGVSLPAGFPSTYAITDRIRGRKGAIQNTGGIYSRSSNPAGIHRHGDGPDCAQQLIETVADMPWGANHSPNYEDLHYAVNEIHEHLSGNYDNPCLEPLIGQLLDKVDWGGLDQDSREGLQDAALEACDLIRSVVAQLLSGRPCSTHLDLLTDVIRAEQFERVDIFTLNHDCHVETALQKAKLPYEDGFRPTEDEDAQVWSRACFDQDSSYVTLCKLHGSVDWHRMQISGCFEDVLIRTQGNIDHLNLNLPQGEMRSHSPYGNPQILVGRHNKILSYTNDWYLELYYCFTRRLERADILIVSGYSFGDKGINGAIIRAFAPCDPRKLLIVIDPAEKSELLEKARYAVASKWGLLESRGLLKHMPRTFDSVNLEDLQSVMTPR